jgi:hypothetical protein
LPVRPISVWDSEYGCAPFVLKTASIPADILVRLRSNLCLWREPEAYSGKGRPKKHGDKFKLNEQTFVVGLGRRRNATPNHSRSVAFFTVSKMRILCPQVICARGCCTNSKSW